MASAFLCEELPRTLECVVCSAPFPYRPRSPKTRCCGLECGLKLSKRIATEKISARVAEERKHTCQQCGAGFVRRSYGKPGENKFCSPTCGHAAKRRPPVPKPPKPPKAPPKARPSRICVVCSKSYQASGTGRPRTTCGTGCTKVLKARSRSAGAAARRARLNGVPVDAVNPRIVFIRDGWRCQMCGRKTPEAKRGTYAPDAPEMDHVIALARGGEHSYGNTQCLCRNCNGRKGAGEAAPSAFSPGREIRIS